MGEPARPSVERATARAIDLIMMELLCGECQGFCPDVFSVFGLAVDDCDLSCVEE